jgi:hypothetical protein
MTPTNRHTDTTTVRLPRDLVEEIRALADEHDRSLSAELRQALRSYLANHAAAVAAAPRAKSGDDRRFWEDVQFRRHEPTTPSDPPRGEELGEALARQKGGKR